MRSQQLLGLSALALSIFGLSPHSKAEMTLSLGGTGTFTSGTSFTISTVQSTPGTTDAAVTPTGGLATSGNLVFAVAAANLGNWTLSGNDFTLTTPGNVAKSSTGWGAIGGGLRTDSGGQAIAFTFNTVGLNLGVGESLVLNSFTVDSSATGVQYIVDGVSVASLDPDANGGTVYTVNSTIADGQRIAWSGHGASAAFKVSQIRLAIVGGGGTLKGTRPNMIFFLGDDQNITDQSAYGNPNVPTPTTQVLSEQGLVFDRMFTPQAICAPSRSALYTGRYPIRNGAFINHRLIRPRIQTLPNYLIPLGYHVILAGKSHVGPDGQFPWTHRWPSLGASEGRPHGWIPINQIENFLANPGSAPFCMMITSHYPHPPWITNKAYTVNGVTIQPGSPGYKSYHASIAEKEAELAAVLAAVEANGLTDNTIIFSADDHGNNGKFTAYDQGLNVAHMVRWPGRIQPGRTGALTSFVDFVPTAIELAGGTAPATLDGRSLLPLFEGKDAVLHDYVYGVTVNQGIYQRKVFPQRSIRDKRYHYVWNFNSLERINREGITNYFHVHGAEWYPNILEEELYDTQNDPAESNNLADLPEYAELKATMKARLFSWMRDQSDYLHENESSPFLYIPDNQFHLDVDAEGDPVPEELKGTMDGQMVDPHTITDPNQALMDTSYGDWLIEHNLFGSQTFDEDGDGYGNLYEFALAGDPADPADYGHPPVLTVESSGGSHQIQYAHSKRRNAAALVSYSLEGRSDLVNGTWNPISTTTEPNPLNADYEMVTHRATFASDTMFLRLAIEAP